MHKQINIYANTIYKEFSPDISAFDKKLKDKWDRLFNDLDSSMSKKELYQASNSIFNTGAYYIRESERYELFRSMYHRLSDMIDDWEQEEEIQ